MYDVEVALSALVSNGQPLRIIPLSKAASETSKQNESYVHFMIYFKSMFIKSYC